MNGVNNNVCNVGYESEIAVNVNQIISEFKEHPSVMKTKKKANYANKFSFTLCSLDEIRKRINMLNTTKPTIYNNIPAKILVEYSDVYYDHIHKLYNHSIVKSTFPDAMKLADITP